MNKVKILAVGIGGYANIYLKELLNRQDPDYEFVGVVDVAPVKATYFSRFLEMGVPIYPTMEAFYGEHRADLAIITTPTHLHTRQILCALRNGSHVMCEKPLSGVSADAEIIVKAMEQAGKFVIIGYQWSFSPAMLQLKQDIASGLYGKALFLKCCVLWPRSKEYFARGIGWGGKIRTLDGVILNDSVVNNAAAHYLHNMLFVTGHGNGVSAEVTDLECSLLRTNEIENFDTAALRFVLDNGANCLFLASHASETTLNPTFEYRFEKGIVSYRSEDAQVIGHLQDGTDIHYGDPFHGANDKIFEAIAAVRMPDYVPPCGVQTAAPQVRCVERIQQHPIVSVCKSRNHETQRANEHFLYTENLDIWLKRCYAEEKILSDYPEFSEFFRGNVGPAPN